MGGAQTKRKRNSCLCGDNPIELRSLQMTSEMASLTPAGTKLVRLCVNVPVIGPEIKDVKNSRSATGKSAYFRNSTLFEACGRALKL